MQKVGLISIAEKIEGSLMAGAIGDSMGAALEAFTLPEILEQTGPAGITALLPYDPAEYVKRGWNPCSQSGIGVITDDTCMLAATAAGLVMAHKHSGAGVSAVHFMHQAFMKWGRHQKNAKGYDAWIDGENVWPHWFKAFCFTSGAGDTTIQALNSGMIGSVETPVYIKSRRQDERRILGASCGGMMRVAPVGWLGAAGLVEDSYGMGVRSAAITHGSAVAQTASGAVAVLIENLAIGRDWGAARDTMLRRLEEDPRATRSFDLWQAALYAGTALGSAISFADIDRLPQEMDAVSKMGHVPSLASVVLVQVAAICAAAQKWNLPDAEKMRRALTLAVTQSGDSDSTGAIVGAVLGAQYGAAAVPQDMMHELQNIADLKGLAAELSGLAAHPHREYDNVFQQTKLSL